MRKRSAGGGLAGGNAAKTGRKTPKKFFEPTSTPSERGDQPRTDPTGVGIDTEPSSLNAVQEACRNRKIVVPLGRKRVVKNG
jgi:hypothetical protein